MGTKFEIHDVGNGYYAVNWTGSGDGSNGPPTLYVLERDEMEDRDDDAMLYVKSNAINKLIASIKKQGDHYRMV